MKTVIVTVASTPFQAPAGTQAKGIQISIAGQAPQVITQAPYVATFNDVPPGSYSAVAQALDVNNNPIGSPVNSDPFSVTDDTVAVDVPVSVTVQVQ